MSDLERLLAESEIERLILDYAAANDAGDWARVAGFYTEDGRMNRPTTPGAFVEGRAAILTAFEARPARVARHIVANIRVGVAGDSATASSQILLFTGAGEPPLVGSYADRLVLTDEGWRFVERRGSLDFAQ
ncbi:MAG: nuclear transport factor 2 family protein [Sphingomonadales bacterium]|nr:MAG: nuclear transport factor 2 family protein [Sphingomonadales bacterium]